MLTGTLNRNRKVLPASAWPTIIGVIAEVDTEEYLRQVCTMMDDEIVAKIAERRALTMGVSRLKFRSGMSVVEALNMLQPLAEAPESDSEMAE